ncbi:hypothetical protein FGO68_gene8067 [Halteria grandinella]|uniref:Uncharacterized protein n=1 Tax=Halteria grandinella TaxID=5974 RepID=A0A8J8P373_HALGN|nr:hypothetical protein FGO68_gene8067 [Halteria grandinella]
MTSPVDQLRWMVTQRFTPEALQAQLRHFNDIYAKIKTYYVAEDMKREEVLEQRREELARLMKEQLRIKAAKAGGSPMKQPQINAPPMQQSSTVSMMNKQPMTSA